MNKRNNEWFESLCVIEKAWAVILNDEKDYFEMESFAPSGKTFFVRASFQNRRNKEVDWFDWLSKNEKKLDRSWDKKTRDEKVKFLLKLLSK